MEPHSKKALKSLDSLTVLFFRVTLGLGRKSGVVSSLYWSTGTYYMSNRILLSKLLFIHHLCHLPEESLGKSFFNTQRKDPKNYNGVVSECLPFLEEWNLSNVEDFSKAQWRRAIKAKIYKSRGRNVLSQ